MNHGYIYIYDDILADRRYEREVAAFESRVNTYGISGRVSRLTLFRSAREIVQETVKQGAGTVVIVGHDGTLDKTMWFLPDLDVVVGYAPLIGHSEIGAALGIPTGADACQVLSARRIETLDVGALDDRYFLTDVSLPATIASLDVEGKYRISPAGGGSIQIRNLGGRTGKMLQEADAKDGFLEVVVTPADGQEKKGWWGSLHHGAAETHLFLKEGEIRSQDPIEIRVDTHAVNGFQFRVRLIPNKLRFITGRGRRFSGPDDSLRTTQKNDMFRPAPVSRFQMKRGV